MKAVAMLVVLAGCAGSQPSPAPFAPGFANRGPLAASAATEQFGAGLGDTAGIAGGAGFTHSWCDGVSGSFFACGEVAGARRFKDSASDTQNLTCSGTKSNGYVSVKFAGTQNIGIGSYSMSGETNETIKCGSGIGAHAALNVGSWDDVLYVSSKTLKKKTPVTIGVKWVLTPVTDIACDRSQNSYGKVELYSPSVTGPKGGKFSIIGSCVKGAFVYKIGKQEGTTAVGTISTRVGASHPIAFSIVGNIVACAVDNECVGDIKASLSGRDKFTITSITKGASYTTASGDLYK
ncbi:MAG: hypothetical protein JO190_04400 [Candidatus Eremiobacteraeota bacterium]|nr:hypothetical protein [Candidatus Eremiobacteraeota bacterium]